jgi:hypothetical protein
MPAVIDPPADDTPSHESAEDFVLVQRAQQGDESAYDELVKGELTGYLGAGLAGSRMIVSRGCRSSSSRRATS